MDKFDKISTRFNKPRRKSLDKHQIKLLKLAEKKEQLERSVAITYRLGKIKYGENFRQDERFFDDFDKIFNWDEKIIKIGSRINKIEEIINQNLAEVRHLCNQLNKTPGGSF